MKKFLLNRAATVLMASLVVVGALIAQPVFALLTGTAASTANTVTAVGADIQIDDDGTGTFGSAEVGSLTASFTASPQVILAGEIDVQNPYVVGGLNWDTGYDLANVANPVASGAANVLLNGALIARVEVTALASLCATGAPTNNGTAFTGTSVQPTGTNSGVAVTSVAWAGTLFSDRPALNDTNTAPATKQERLCFYLLLPTGNDGAAGASLTYDLTFTAN